MKTIHLIALFILIGNSIYCQTSMINLPANNYAYERVSNPIEICHNEPFDSILLKTNNGNITRISPFVFDWIPKFSNSKSYINVFKIINSDTILISTGVFNVNEIPLIFTLKYKASGAITIEDLDYPKVITNDRIYGGNLCSLIIIQNVSVIVIRESEVILIRNFNSDCISEFKKLKDIVKKNDKIIFYDIKVSNYGENMITIPTCDFYIE